MGLGKTILPWDEAEMRAWARRVCGRKDWRLCGLAMSVLRLQHDHEVLTRLCENVTLERDQLRHRLEGLDK